MMDANNISREATVHVSYIWNLKHYLPRDWSSFSCPETNEDKFEDKQLNLNFFPKLQYLDTNKIEKNQILLDQDEHTMENE